MGRGGGHRLLLLLLSSHIWLYLVRGKQEWYCVYKARLKNTPWPGPLASLHCQFLRAIPRIVARKSALAHPQCNSFHMRDFPNERLVHAKDIIKSPANCESQHMNVKNCCVFDLHGWGFYCLYKNNVLKLEIIYKGHDFPATGSPWTRWWNLVFSFLSRPPSIFGAARKSRQTESSARVVCQIMYLTLRGTAVNAGNCIGASERTSDRERVLILLRILLGWINSNCLPFNESRQWKTVCVSTTNHIFFNHRASPFCLQLL